MKAQFKVFRRWGLGGMLLFWVLALPALAAQPWTAQVVGVADGDTITVLQGTKQTKIRLHGIDCPEKSQPYGKKAKQFTSDACFGKTVRILPKTTDRYGRTVAVVLLENGQPLNLELLRAGLAWHYRKYSSDPDYARTEDTARAEGLGLWREPDPVPPWEFRENKRNGQASERAESAGVYHGNVKSRVFHGPTCRAFDCKNCITGFESREAAIQAGFRPCGMCNP